MGCGSAQFKAAAWSALTAILLAAAPPAGGLELGEPEIRSALGQPLSLRIPYRLAKDEILDASCVRLPARPATAERDIPTIVKPPPTLHSQAGKNYIVLESAQPFNDPVARLVIEVQCGLAAAITHERVVLFDPPRPLPALVLRAPEALSTASGGRAAAASPPESIVAAPAQAAANKRELRQATAAGELLRPREPAGKPVLRIEPAIEKVVAPGGVPLCCFRLAYELADTGAPPPTEAERNRLRQQMRDYMSDEDPVTRLQALRSEVDALKKQLAAPVKAIEVTPARKELPAPQAQEVSAVRDYVLSAVYLLVALALVAALVQWLRKKRQQQGLPGNAASVAAGRRAGVQAATMPAVAAPEVAEPISISGLDLGVTAGAAPAAPPVSAGSLDVDFSRTVAIKPDEVAEPMTLWRADDDLKASIAEAVRNRSADADVEPKADSATPAPRLRIVTRN